MIFTVIRVLAGFIVACLAAAATQVAFVKTTDLLTVDLDQLGLAGLLVMAAATQILLFAGLFALVAIVAGEWQRIRNWAFYVLAGLAISIAGFIWVYSTEVAWQPSNYGLAAFLVSGLAGGGIYWLLAGRYAGPSVFDIDEEDEDDIEIKRPQPPSAAPAGPNFKKI